MENVSNNALLITTIGGLLTLVASHIFDMLKRNRQYKWDSEERERVAGALAQHVELARVKLSTENKEQRAILAAKIDAASENAQLAYKEANGVNAKMAGLQEEVSDKLTTISDNAETARAKASEVSDKADTIGEIGQDTNERVRNIEGNNKEKNDNR